MARRSRVDRRRRRGGASDARRVGVPTEGVVVADGSGLDRGNRATCRESVAVLEQGGAAVRAGLAVAGETGTLSDAFTNNPVRASSAARPARSRVKSLAGVLDVPDHELEFALVLNVANADAAARPLWEQLGTGLRPIPIRWPSTSSCRRPRSPPAQPAGLGPPHDHDGDAYDGDPHDGARTAPTPHADAGDAYDP